MAPMITKSGYYYLVAQYTPVSFQICSQYIWNLAELKKVLPNYKVFFLKNALKYACRNPAAGPMYHAMHMRFFYR